VVHHEDVRPIAPGTGLRRRFIHDDRRIQAQRFLLPLAAVASAFGVSACELKDDGNDLVNGKSAFVAKCGSCHVLERAGTSGVTGPNLDAAFARAVSEGFGRSTVEGVVRRQIQQPNTTSQVDPATGKLAGAMEADIVKGETAEDVAAYVAFATARGGEDEGRLADVGVKKADGVAKAQGGAVKIPADPGGGLAYTFASAEGPAGALTLTSPNESTIPHNLAIEGGGLNEKGPVVESGGVSELKVTVKAGEYTFYCSVPGHREGGMVGKLTVK